MASLDFPASPTTGQLFTGGNGVSYRYDGTLWLVQAGPGGGTGDFFATKTTDVSLTASYATMIPNTVITGNAGAWYSTSTGRYTPPAGRFFVQVWMTVLTGVAAAVVDFALRKNGTLVDHSSYSTANGQYGPLVCSGTYDANGSDYFDFAAASNANAIAKSVEFVAYPLTGMQGPAGPPGQLGFRLLQRTDVSSAVADVNIQAIPADINDLKFTFDLTHVANNTQSILQFYNNTGALVTAGQYGSAVTLTTSVMAAGVTPFVISGNAAGITNAILLTYSAAGNNVSNALPIRGSGTICNIRAAGRPKTVDFQSIYLNDGATAWNIITGSGVWGTSPTAITGFRIAPGGGNIASGSFSVWGSA